MASGLLKLGAKLGPFLWQFPPTMKYDRALFDDFLAMLPRDTDAASALARRRDRGLMRGRSVLKADRNRRLRHAVEIRHESFRCDDFVDLAPVSEAPANAVKDAWAPLLSGQAVPLIGEDRHGRIEEEEPC